MSPSAGSTTPPGEQTVAVGKVTLPVAAGFTLTSHTATYACISTAAVHCALQVVDVGVAKRTDPTVTNPFTGHYPWWTHTGSPQCGSATGSGETSAVSNFYTDHSVAAFMLVGTKTAVFGAWRVTCAEPLAEQRIRAWWLPTSMIYLIEYHASTTLDGEVNDIVRRAVWAT